MTTGSCAPAACPCTVRSPHVLCHSSFPHPPLLSCFGTALCPILQLQYTGCLSSRVLGRLPFHPFAAPQPAEAFVLLSGCSTARAARVGPREPGRGAQMRRPHPTPPRGPHDPLAGAARQPLHVRRSSRRLSTSILRAALRTTARCWWGWRGGGPGRAGGAQRGSQDGAPWAGRAM